MTINMHVDKSKLVEYITEIERRENDKEEISEIIRITYSDAKADGFNTAIMRNLVKMRKMNPNELKEQEILLKLYQKALGMTEI